MRFCGDTFLSVVPQLVLSIGLDLVSGRELWRWLPRAIIAVACAFAAASTGSGALFGGETE